MKRRNNTLKSSKHSTVLHWGAPEAPPPGETVLSVQSGAEGWRGQVPRGHERHSAHGWARWKIVPLKCRISAEFRDMFFWDFNIKTNPTLPELILYDRTLAYGPKPQAPQVCLQCLKPTEGKRQYRQEIRSKQGLDLIELRRALKLWERKCLGMEEFLLFRMTSWPFIGTCG